ncbi:CoA-transferase [Benzoatithermus flavus]|uniref:CoA-transferase n=1 Tax=Benzoatithermus flavus TaxID=3108223 RepID=A0ABU8XW75_9PROT
MREVYEDAQAALSGLLRDGRTIVTGGFGLRGIPERGVSIEEARARTAAPVEDARQTT